MSTTVDGVDLCLTSNSSRFKQSGTDPLHIPGHRSTSRWLSKYSPGAYIAVVADVMVDKRLQAAFSDVPFLADAPQMPRSRPDSDSCELKQMHSN